MATPTSSTGWQLTVYYTAVESFHSGPPRRVTGCVSINCSNGSSDLGTYPADFVQAVHDEGTGRITSGPNSGKYLNWSVDVAYWLDTAPRDDRGKALVPFVSAAADPSVAFGTRFVIVECGTDGGQPIDAAVCAKVKAARWMVSDRFTAGAVGKHIDLYIGEESGPGFTSSAWYFTANNSTLRFE